MFLAIFTVTLGADLYTKRWAESTLDQISLNAPDYSWMDGHIRLRLAHNTGVAFGMFGGSKHSRWILSFVGIMVLGFLFYFLRTQESDHPMFLSGLSLVTAGAVGNLWDRILYGHVTDFIQIWITPSIKILWPWPNFNIADVVLAIGIGLMVLYTYLHYENDSSEASGD